MMRLYLKTDITLPLPRNNRFVRRRCPGHAVGLRWMVTGRQGRGAVEAHKGDQEQIRRVRARTRDNVPGSRSSDRSDGRAVSLRLVLMSFFPGPPDHAPLASCRLDSSIRVIRYSRLDSSVSVVRYGRAPQAVKEVVVKSRRNLDEFALHALRIGEATAVAAGGYISELVIEREGR